MTILHQIPSEAKIRRKLKSLVFGKVLFCPHCGSKKVKKYGKRYHCKLCRKHFSLTSSTWLKGMKLPLQTFWSLLWCWVNKVPVDQAKKFTALSEPTVRGWYEKFRNNLPQDKLDALRLEGEVQIDEAYRGPKIGKFSIIGAKQAKNKDKRKALFKVLPKKSVDRKDTVDFLAQGVVPGSNLFSDGAGIYRGIGNWWPVNHAFERHNKWEFTITSEIEGLWGNLFTFIRKMYHHVTKDKVEGTVKEFQARFCFPEWFLTPDSYLEISLKPKVVFASKKEEENLNEFTFQNMLIYTLNQAKKSKVLVPSC